LSPQEANEDINNEIPMFTTSEAKEWLDAEINKTQEFLKVSDLVESLRSETKPGGRIDPSPDESESVQANTWGYAMLELWKRGLREQALQIGLAWYARLSEFQCEKRTHKGISAHWTAHAYLGLNQRHGAWWFSTLAFVEDAITHSQAFQNSDAARVLQHKFHRSEARSHLINKRKEFLYF
jgi:hypothetical protein